MLSFFIMYGMTHAQGNLVLNPSFEDTIACPNSVGQINLASNWSAYALSPDYFNSCNANQFSVPTNFGGYQKAATCNAYCGLICYAGQGAGLSNTREFVGGNLASAVVIGQKYFVSLKVSLCLNATTLNCASNNIGINFSIIAYNPGTGNPAPISNSAKVFVTSIVVDSVNWIKISGSFIADSAYSHIIIGNFFNDANTDTLLMDGGSSWKYAYYYLDDVCVSTDSMICKNIHQF